MTSPLWPSSRVPATAAAALVAAALLLGLPASSFATGDPRAAGPQTERGESSATALTSAGPLARGSGYGKQSGSQAVRELQRRLHRLGHRPGPVDGLFGPLTEASVERFQRARGLQVDGLVGPRTRARLLAVTARRPAPPPGRATPKPSAPDRLAPDRPAPADVAPPRQPTPDAARPATRTPESSDGLDPWLAALLGALATAVLFAGLSRLRRPRSGERAVERAASRPSRGRPNLGLAFALLLAVFATGAAVGALFATHATPGDRGGSEVAGGALLSPPAPSPVARPAEPPRPSRPAAPRRRARPAGTAPAPVPPPATSKPAEPSPQPAGAERAPAATAPAGPVAPASPAAPVEKADAAVEKADAPLALRVKRLVDLKLEEHAAPGGSDLLTAGERQGVP
jgi:hypothetical protein